jgi:hypothetical protein
VKRFFRPPENKVYQYRWALRHPVVKEAITLGAGQSLSFAVDPLSHNVDFIFVPEVLAPLYLSFGKTRIAALIRYCKYLIPERGGVLDYNLEVFS